MLSDAERAMLREIEESLYASDPRLASQLRSGRVGSRMAGGVLAVLVGFACLLGGVATGQIVLGVAGFVVAHLGCLALWHARERILIQHTARQSRPSGYDLG